MFPYQGGNNKEEIKKFLDNPSAEAPEKPKEESWADEPSEVNHLTEVYGFCILLFEEEWTTVISSIEILNKN